MRSRCLVAGLVLFASLPAPAQRTPVPLNDYSRLGQRFTATRPLVTVRVCVPSWSDNEGGLTLTLWDSPERGRVLVERVLTGIRDNEMVELQPAKPLPAGAYYWEIAERTGTTRIGLYCDALPADSEDCAYLDGNPDPRRRFVFEVVCVALPRPSVAALVTALDTGSTAERVEACRLLAVFATPEAVPALARLLADPELSHMARYALESLPARSVDEAFEAALASLSGVPLAGVINSVAVRGDADAVDRLAVLLQNEDQDVARAAAVALGRIGTPAAAEALGKALIGPASPLSLALFEGGLSCAGRLAGSGHGGEAIGLYDRLRSAPAPTAVRTAAARGAVLARGRDGLDLLRELLRSSDHDLRDVALWIVQHELPGRSTSVTLASELEGLPAESQVLLIAALAGRGDAAALPTVEAAAAAGALPTRLAAVGALPRFGGDAAPGLLRLLDDPDPEVRQAAQNGLAELPRRDATSVATDLLRGAEAPKRQVAVALIHRLLLSGFGDGLATALGDPSAEVRAAAAKAMADLADAPQVPALREALLSSTDAGEAEAIERALSAACVRAGDPEAMAQQLLAGMAGATPSQRAALLRVLGAIGGDRALQAVREAVAGADGEVHTAALDVLCTWPTDAAAPDLLRLARGGATPEEALRCLRGLLRLAANQDLDAGRRLQLCQEANDLIQRDEEKKLLLGALGSLGAFEALDLALPHLDSPATKEEACAAVLGLAERLVNGDEAARLAGPLERVAATTANADVAKRAQALLEQAKQAK